MNFYRKLGAKLCLIEEGVVIIVKNKKEAEKMLDSLLQSVGHVVGRNIYLDDVQKLNASYTIRRDILLHSAQGSRLI